ncbi:uncharacterized protein PHACADRAFT_58680, partial [Phanerochaete carnosa HHB-10118-sp]
LYWLEAEVLTRTSEIKPGTLMSVKSDDPYTLWHRRFGHARKKSVVQLPGNVKGVLDKISAPTRDTPCDGCKFGKSRRDAFPASDSCADHPLDLIHMDLVKYPSLSLDGYKFALTTLDDYSSFYYSSFGLVWYLKRKSDAFSAFKQFVTWAETQAERKLKAIRLNRGGEFLGREFNDFLAERGIERQLSVARTPQQNGRAECWQQTIQNKAEAMRHHAGMTSGFWKLASETAVHIYNRQPLRCHQWKPPITKWNGTVPDVLYFRVWGCKAYVHTHKDVRVNKLQPKAKVMIFIGYKIGTKGYRFWDPTAWTIVVSRDVTFDESSFPKRDDRPREPGMSQDPLPPVLPDLPNPDLTSPDDFTPDDHSPDNAHPQPRQDEPQQEDDDKIPFAPGPPSGPPPPQREHYRPHQSGQASPSRQAAP